MKAQIECTLLDLIQTIGKVTDNDQEVVATVVSLVNSGRVRLCGNFAGAKITFDSPVPFPPRLWPALLGHRVAA